MNRKLFWIIPLSLITLSSCSLFDGGETVDEFKAIKEVLNLNYSQFKVEVDTKKDDLQLHSSYNITKQNNGYLTEYCIQEYATFDLENNVIPKNMIETKEGSYMSDNKKFNISNFVVSKESFNKYSLSENEFVGNLSNGKDYLHTNYNCYNFKIVIKFNTTLQSIVLNYKLDDSTQCNVSYSQFIA